MTAFILSPEAEEDLWAIWHYLAEHAGSSVAERVEAMIVEKSSSWRTGPAPGIGGAISHRSP